MPVPTSIDDLSTTASSNSPAGTEGPGDGDNYIRAHGAFIATLRDKLDGTSATGTLTSPEILGAPSGSVVGGTYTPSFTVVTNISTLLDQSDGIYARVGTAVTVSGQVTVTPTSASSCVLRVSLPIGSALTQSKDAAGVCSVGRTDVGDVVADFANGSASIRFTAPNTSSQFIAYTFSYVVK